MIVANLFEGLQISHSGGPCEFEPIAAFDEEVVTDVVLTAEDGSRIHALTSTGSQAGLSVQLWESTDTGQSFTVVGGLDSLGFSGTSVCSRLVRPDAGVHQRKGDDERRRWRRAALGRRRADVSAVHCPRR